MVALCGSFWRTSPVSCERLLIALSFSDRDMGVGHASNFIFKAK